MKEQDIYKFVDSEFSKIAESVESIKRGSYNLKAWVSIFRLAGYCMLILNALNIVELFIPPGFMNPAWEFKTIAILVERVPIPLIGFILVFAGGLDWRSRWEGFLLKFLYWLILLFGILYLIFVPVGIMNTIRLNDAINANINLAYNQKTSQAEQFEKQINQATPEQLSNALRSQGQNIDGKNPQQLKSEILTQLNQAKEKLKDETDNNKSVQRLDLLKNATKMIVGALVSGTFFILIWKTSDWAR